MARPIIIRDDHTRRIAIDFLTSLNLDGKEWDVTVEPHRKKRTNPQNAWMHAMFSEIAKETGNSAADVKDFYCEEFLGLVEVTLGGKTRMVRRSTTTLKTKEAAEFCAQIHAHAATELGIFLKHPDDMGRAAA
jgi:hypothetical protein